MLLNENFETDTINNILDMIILIIKSFLNCNTGATDEGAWSPWTQYSDCTLTCGGGKKTRTRTCVWGICSGPTNSTEDCGTDACHSKYYYLLIMIS